MPVTRWTLYNPESGQTLTFPRNPLQGVAPRREKKITSQTSSSPDGQPLIFEGPQEVRMAKFSGSIKDEAHYRFMVAWFNLENACRVTNHLGEWMDIYMTVFDPKPKNRHNNPWAADFEAEGIIIGASL